MFINENNLKELPQADVIPPSLELDSAASVRGDNFSMEQEVWVKTKESEYYEVSSHFRFKSLKPCKNGLPPVILSTPISKTGYFVVNMYIDGKNHVKKAHRLFAQAFIPNPENLPQINHKDGNKLNNSISNLEWCTGEFNVRHAFKTGLIPKCLGENQSATVLKNEQVLKIFKSKKSSRLLSIEYGCSPSAVSSIKTGKTWGWLTGLNYSKSRERVKFSNKIILEVFNSNDGWAHISNKYGVSISHIGFIKSGRAYSKLTGKVYAPANRLTSNQIKEIKSSKESNIELAAKFNVHKDTIRNIKKDAYNYKSRN